MKDKDRVSVMVCNAADGWKFPLYMVGKAVSPRCFNLLKGQPLPIPYMNQKNSWFDKKVFLHWLRTVFIPHYKKRWGELPCLLLLDGCAVQTEIDPNDLPPWLFIEYFPPRLTGMDKLVNSYSFYLHMNNKRIWLLYLLYYLRPNRSSSASGYGYYCSYKTKV